MKINRKQLIKCTIQPHKANISRVGETVDMRASIQCQLMSVPRTWMELRWTESHGNSRNVSVILSERVITASVFWNIVTKMLHRAPYQRVERRSLAPVPGVPSTYFASGDSSTLASRLVHLR